MYYLIRQYEDKNECLEDWKLWFKDCKFTIASDKKNKKDNFLYLIIPMMIGDIVLIVLIMILRLLK
jgi:hypothetical protein